MTHVFGIDPSLSNSGIAHFSPDSETPWLGHVITKPPAVDDTEGNAWRILDVAKGIYGQVMRRVPAGVDNVLVVIEGPSIGSVNGKPDERAGLRWQLVCAFVREGFRVVLVPPATVKLYWVRKGNAKKAAMLGWARQRYQIPIRDDNEADALALAHMGATHLGMIGVAIPTVMVVELDKVAWPI